MIRSSLFLVTCILMSLAMLFVLHSSAIQVHAAPITFEFTGVWDSMLLPNGPVQPGDTFRGNFFSLNLSPFVAAQNRAN